MTISRIALVAAALAAAAFGASAEARGSEFNAPKTRTEVRAELDQFKAAGVNPFSISYNPLANFVSTRSRADVRAELDQYQAAGVNTFSITYNPLSSFASAKSRAEVRAEYIANRDAVAAMNGEDGGSAYITAHRASQAGVVFAGDPVRAE